MSAVRTGQVTDQYTLLPVPGASIYVYNQDGTTATVYSDVGLSIPLAQPLTADQFGTYTYHAADNVYREDTWYGGKLRYKEILFVGSPPQFKGDPGANAMAIGVFSGAATLTIPVGTNVVRTSGYSTDGVGGAYYVNDAAVTSSYVTGHPRSSFISANGRGFRLVTDGIPITPESVGATADGTANDQAAFDEINTLASTLGYAWIRLSPKKTYRIGKQTANSGGYYQLGGIAINANGLSSFILEGNGATLKFNDGLKFGGFDTSTGLAANVATTAGRADIGYGIAVQLTARVRITDLTVDGNSAAMIIGGTVAGSYQETHYGIWLQKNDNVSLENVVAFNHLTDNLSYDWGSGGLTDSDTKKPYTMTNCRFYAAGRNSITLGGCNAVTWTNVSSKHSGAPVTGWTGGATFSVSPATALDIESISIIRNVRIFGGSFEEGAVANTAIVADSGDSRDIIFTGTRIVGALWANKPRMVFRDCAIFGYLATTYHSATDPADNTLFDHCQLDDGTAGDTPQQNPGGNFITAATGAIISGGSTIRLAHMTADFRGMTMKDVQVTLAMGTDVLADASQVVNMSGTVGEYRRVAFIDALPTGATAPATGYFVLAAVAPTIFDECSIVSAGNKLHWGSVSGPQGIWDTKNRLADGILGYGPTGLSIGSAVVQATSKSTAVTKNNPCGQITMSNAALAANTAVSFTLTNSAILADDDVRVWVKSGFATPATYRAWSEGNAVGSRTIALQNISAGSLSEAVVLGFAIVRTVVS